MSTVVFERLRNEFIRGNMRGRLGPIKLYNLVRSALQYMNAKFSVDTTKELNMVQKCFGTAEPFPMEPWRTEDLDALNDLLEFLVWRICYWHFTDRRAWNGEAE